MNTVLVTGAQGFVGRYLVAELLRTDPNRCVVGIGRSPDLSGCFTHAVTRDGQRAAATLPADLAASLASPRYRYQQADLQARGAAKRIVATVRPDTVIHLASARREESAAQLIRGNVLGTQLLIEACGGLVRRVVVGSSASVYGVPAELPLRECAACRPADAYAASKLAAEQFACVACAANGVELAIARIFNVVGPGQDERHVCGRLASELAAIARGLRPPRFDVRDLETTRDFVDVRDVASALTALACHRTAEAVCNVGSGIESSVRDVLQTLITVAGLDDTVVIHAAPGTAGPSALVSRHVADMTHARTVGVVTNHDLRASLTGVYRYYQ